MKDRPILFSGPMVRALLAGTKTQTRRIAPIDRLDIKDHGDGFVSWAVGFTKPMGKIRSVASYSGSLVTVDQARSIIASQFCPYGQPGDKLWVREAFRLCAEADATPPRNTHAAYRIWYEADAPHQPGSGKLRPGMFMPRWASRLTLEITSVRVERLQSISGADAIAEGLDFVPDGAAAHGIKGLATSWSNDPRKSYSALWVSINGPESWEANPWVWVVGFRRVQP